MDTNGHEYAKNVVQAVFEPRKTRNTRKNTKEGEEGEPRMDTNGTRKRAWMARLGAPAWRLANSCVLLTLR